MAVGGVRVSEGWAIADAACGGVADAVADPTTAITRYCLPSCPGRSSASPCRRREAGRSRAPAPVSMSKARIRRSRVAAMNTSPPAVTIGPPRLGLPRPAASGRRAQTCRAGRPTSWRRCRGRPPPARRRAAASRAPPRAPGGAPPHDVGRAPHVGVLRAFQPVPRLVRAGAGIPPAESAAPRGDPVDRNDRELPAPDRSPRRPSARRRCWTAGPGSPRGSGA